VTALPLTTSYWPADTSSPVQETTIGGVLRAAAGRAPGQPALIFGDPDPARRRQWRYGELLAGAERAAPRCSDGLSPATGSRCGRATAPNGCCSSSPPGWPG
jgi:acyl-CoA synthetase (AMP-forming)/AMP-acid ligase II